MQFIKKQIVTDERLQPVAVILQQHEQELMLKDSVDASEALAAYAGSIQLTIDPLKYQRETRNAWL